MKVLMLTPYLPYPPASGGQIRSLYLLKYLKKNHDITLVSLYKNEKEKKYAKDLESYCNKIYLCKRAEKPWQINNIIRAVFTDLPFLIVRNYSKEAKVVIERLIKKEKFDVIHAETFYIMPHIPKTKIPTLLVEQTIEYKVYQHYISTLPSILKFPLWFDILKLKHWETYYWKKANKVAAVSQFDQKQIKKVAPSVNPVIIPNGAGDSMFVNKLPKKNLNKPQILFIGNFFWLQNVEAAQYLIEHVFPALQAKIPNATLIIAGQNSSTKISVENNPNIKVIDLKPDDDETVKRLYHTATIFLAPIFGPGGTRLKILASMAAGLPVISTKTGFEGLNVTKDIHGLFAENSQEFINQTLRILSDESLYNSIQSQAFEHVKNYFSWEAIAKKLEKVYQEIIQ